MRNIGRTENEGNARRFLAYLQAQGIEGVLREGSASDWQIWIYAEDDVARARREYRAFEASPDDPKYAATPAPESPAAAKPPSQPDQTVKLRERWRSSRPRAGAGTVTPILIGLSVVITLVAEFRLDSPLGALLTSQSTMFSRGELWRLVTPIFLHLDFMHLFFNMLWMYYLGMMIELRQPKWFLPVFALVAAVGSNYLQFRVTGPNFGGMSGVVFGLFGYVWMRAKLEPRSGYYLEPSTVVFMLVFMGFCMLGLFKGLTGQGVANWAHGGGLAVGVAVGALTSIFRRRRRSSLSP